LTASKSLIRTLVYDGRRQKMRVVIIGASGTIGKSVVKSLSKDHEVVQVAHSKGEHKVDLADKESIERLFKVIGPFDALVCAAGAAKFAPLESLTDGDFHLSLSNKLMGQVNLVRVGMFYIRDNGSITLTSGLLAKEPMPGSAAVSLVNAAIEGFVRAAALEMPRGVRVNAVSPPWVKETLAAMGRDASGGMQAAKVAAAYVESVKGRRNGEIIDARDFA
jgi:NAD(P)-dependent dehydrogenase (short-subunit alcohol dehydrogenase family)